MEGVSQLMQGVNKAYYLGRKEAWGEYRLSSQVQTFCSAPFLGIGGSGLKTAPERLTVGHVKGSDVFRQGL